MNIFQTRFILTDCNAAVVTRLIRCSIFWKTTSKSITKVIVHLSDCLCTRPGLPIPDTSRAMKSNPSKKQKKKTNKKQSNNSMYYWLNAGFWIGCLHLTTFISPPSASCWNGSRTRYQPTTLCLHAMIRVNRPTARKWFALTNQIWRRSVRNVTWISATGNARPTTLGIEILTVLIRQRHGTHTKATCR